MSKTSPFNVPYVKKSLQKKPQLNCHILRMHERKKPYACKVCDHKCSDKGNLRKHIALVHERKKRLNRHMASVHGKNRCLNHSKI